MPITDILGPRPEVSFYVGGIGGRPIYYTGTLINASIASTIDGLTEFNATIDCWNGGHRGDAFDASVYTREAHSPAADEEDLSSEELDEFLNSFPIIERAIGRDGAAM